MSPVSAVLPAEHQAPVVNAEAERLGFWLRVGMGARVSIGGQSCLSPQLSRSGVGDSGWMGIPVMGELNTGVEIGNSGIPASFHR